MRARDKGQFTCFFHYAQRNFENKVEMLRIKSKYNVMNKVEMLRIKSTLLVTEIHLGSDLGVTDSSASCPSVLCLDSKCMMKILKTSS